ncbi:protocatechuate 3,4-dioxygenase [Rubellicoccus peritrichatus]|uniref:Protocatechuate 3,4-dioxygenase n=1 Tax=Rubellicoccus peritrichatus TaxID=3080537 RepID=A0AAQ3LAM5_9BACT|nr:protocatechuate 3,4-dioxygenase [Puniceicoccus sp. CR14]WOO40702.1 protocatechuate 3,4-dioxygenase [Puniceicoccus sp. CR14]
MKNKNKSRRSFLKWGFAGAVSGVVGNSTQARSVSTNLLTPAEIEGPFYPITAQKDKDFDLTKIDGKEGSAKGKAIVIEGRVIGVNGDPLEDVMVDLWQANAAGRYRHPHDSNSAPLDENFQGWAIVPSGSDGSFRFKTVYPGAYPAANGWTRPPHIHFRFIKSGYAELITQMYFPNHKLNDRDVLLQRKSKEEQKLMTASLVGKNPETYRYTVVLMEA